MPMLWRYALAMVGARRNSSRRYVPGERGRTPPPAEAVRRFLRFYGPATSHDLQAWAGLGRGHARRVWGEIEDELDEVEVDGRRAFILANDRDELESPLAIRGLRMLPPGDPFLQQPNRADLVPDAELRKRTFRAVASPGVVLQDGQFAGLWRARARGKRLEVTVEQLAAIDRDALETEADRVARLRGADGAAIAVS
jgi:Winged helix DNA-binding domain